ncbi:gp38 [Streptomyces phage phiSASD1]|uniref:Gp38 n=1 Tax=Streptomyces phage phiSASD1 TaxID=747763 RepID=D7NW64_9CAUD|nr:gp38 [Streptomyces phage phiSASD1]ADE43462.1 gp38 [Streptomyces phage phiSASD1]
MALFPLDIRTELKLGATWMDISSDVLQRDVKNITRGVRDQGSTADPASLSLTLNNRSGKYSVRNAESPLYGLIGRNTQVRLSVPTTGDSYLNLDGLAGNFASTPDVAALNITGDLDVRIEMAPNWYGAENQVVIGKWAPGQASWMVQVYNGTVIFRYTTTGTEPSPTLAYTRPLPTLPERAALRVTLDVDDGSGNHVTTFYWAPTLAGPWTPIGNPAPYAGTAPMFAGSAPLRIGLDDFRPNTTTPRLPMVGRVYRAEVRSGIDGTIVASPDFRGLADRTTSFTDSSGRSWSTVGGAEIRHREDRFVGEISTWPLKWTADASDIWTSVRAAGILHRLGQGTKDLDSTLRRRIPSGKPIAYWPMEDASDATRAYSPIPGVQPASVSGVEWAAAGDLPSSNPLPVLGQAGNLTAPIPGTMPSGEWQVEFVYNADDKAPPYPGEEAPFIAASSPNGAVRRWEISMQRTRVHIRGYNAGGTALVGIYMGAGDDIFHGWTRLRLYAKDQGDGTFIWRIAFQDVGGDAGGISGTVTGSCGRLSAVTANWGPLTEGWSIGHLTVLPVAGSGLMNGSDDAFSGESAWDRLARLGREEGLSIGRIPGQLPPQRVGPQRPAKLIDLLESVADSDGGWLTESPRRVGLTYRDRSSAYGQEPALTLSYIAPGLSDGLEPVDDDSAIRNDITVTRDGGSSARAYEASGPLSVLPPPNGIGIYDEGVTLSLSDDTQPEPIANWRLHLGTFDGARYPVVTVTLHKTGAEGLLPQVLGLREGDVIRLTNLPKWLSHADVDLIVMGWTESLELYRWTIEFNCLPGGPWDTAKVNVVHEDFEDDNYAIPLAAAGSLPWVRSTAHAHTGTSALKSGAITNNQTSDAVLSLPAGVTELSFWYFTNSENFGTGFTGDYLTVLADGVEVLRAQGSTPWTKKTLNVTGVSTIVFRYRKDNSAASGEDAVWIDNLRMVYGTYRAAKVQTDGSTLTAPVNATATSLTVASPAAPWTTNPIDLPIPITVDGEVMSVTAINVDTSPQIFTVTRSVNGVSKSHLAGASVTLARPAVAPL